ncbi:efflux RND transporter permease subunit [Sorangium sp. So ce764]
MAKYSDNGRRIDVRARLLAEQRSRPEDLARIQVRSASGALVPLTSVVSYEELPALQAITRRDRERAISIATSMAAVPSALALGPGAEIRAPMAAAVIGGLHVSTALSLLDDHTPCYRQDVESDRHGFRIGRGNMTGWQ